MRDINWFAILWVLVWVVVGTLLVVYPDPVVITALCGFGISLSVLLISGRVE